MNAVKIWNVVAARLGRGLIVALVWAGLTANAALEETFDVLQIGTHTYKNVTVTTKAKDYIFILHSAGMANIKVKDLPPELATQLGYVQKPNAETKPALAWLKNTTSTLENQQLPQLEERVPALGAVHSAVLAMVSPRRLPVVLAVVVLLYLFFCYCCSAICQKAGHPPGVLVWVPVLQMVPLLRAAQMSGVWLLAFLVPVLNLVAHVIWSFKIVKARAKSPVFGLLLLLPVTNLFAFLYLAFSAAPAPVEKPVVEIMTLDAA